MSSFVSGKWHWRNQIARCNDSAWVPLLRNKYLFHEYCSRLSIPLPQLIGVFNNVWGYTSNGLPLRNSRDLHQALQTASPSGLVVKPVAGTWGVGVQVYPRMDVGRGLLYSTTNSEPITFASLAESLIAASSSEGVLLEERVSPHPFCVEINLYSASTIRVITLRRPSGDIHIVFSAIRLGRLGAIVDNVSVGGIFAEVNSLSGVIGRGRQYPYRRRIFFDSHPDSGVTFCGRQVPRWSEIIALCTNAAKGIPGINTVGWDVLLSPEGPVLREGNHDWAVQGTQIFGRGYMTETVRNILAEYGAAT